MSYTLESAGSVISGIKEAPRNLEQLSDSLEVTGATVRALLNENCYSATSEAIEEAVQLIRESGGWTSLLDK